jgi:hypothetical protein
VKSHIWGVTYYGTETWTLQKINHKFLASSETWCWKRMEKISVSDRVRIEELLLGGKLERNVLLKIKRGLSGLSLLA